jgi:hypothetical protein
MSNLKFEKNENTICFITQEGHGYCEKCNTHFSFLTWNDELGITSRLRLRCMSCGDILRTFSVCEIKNSDMTIEDYKNIKE